MDSFLELALRICRRMNCMTRGTVSIICLAHCCGRTSSVVASDNSCMLQPYDDEIVESRNGRENNPVPVEFGMRAAATCEQSLTLRRPEIRYRRMLRIT